MMLIATLLVLNVCGMLTLPISVVLRVLFTMIIRYFLLILWPEPKSMNSFYLYI